MTHEEMKAQIIWLEDRVNGLEKRLEKVECYNKPIATPDDDLNNVRYKASYRYETKQPLTEAYIDDLCDEYLLWQIEPVGIRGILHKLIRAVEKAHGIGEKE
jgi:hypothetical protein